MKITYTLIANIVISGFLLCSCGEHNHNHDHAHSHGQVSHSEEENDGHEESDEIVMSPTDAEKFGVKVETVTESPFNFTIDATGEIFGASNDIATVSAPTSGIITFNSHINVGITVNQGASLGRITSTGVSGGNADKAALATLNAAKAELDRLTPLFADGLVTRSEYNNAKADYERAKASYSPGAASGSVITPISGIISELLVQTGAYVTIGQPVATVSKNSTLVLRADLPERFRNAVNTINSANVRNSAGNWINVTRAKSAQNIGSTITPGYIPVYFTLTDTDTFSSGSFVDVCLIGSNSSPAISISNSSISEQQGEYFVYVKIDEHGYRKRNVKLGQSDGLRTVILSGLTPGENVVSEGVTMIRLAETSTVVPEGHSHNH